MARGGRPGGFKKRKVKEPSLAEAVFANDLKRFRHQHGVVDDETPLETQKEVVVEIKDLSAAADGMGLAGGRVVIVPSTLPGDTVRAKVYRNDADGAAYADLLEVQGKSDRRQDELVRCRYFGKCSGCQLQMLSYQRQLAHKRNVIDRAYAEHLTEYPAILDTQGSPIEYGYRTKITPHFDKSDRGEEKGYARDVGFNEKGRRRVVDIEDCPIATDVLRQGLVVERKRVLDNWSSFKRGATLLLRETATEGGPACLTKSSDIATERFGQFKFLFPAGEFFQNNNAIMPALTDYVRQHLWTGTEGKRFLVDAYCGSGLFSITCSGECDAVAGVEISQDSVSWARRNAEENGVKNAEFLVGEAQKLFEKIEFPALQTAVVIDPPRKGCDREFISQLMAFGPRRIVYVSCNVHTQARDVAQILEHGTYTLESVRGFDLFPQTHHVESVAVLNRKMTDGAALTPVGEDDAATAAPVLEEAPPPENPA